MALATIVATAGSTPRAAGARMVVHPGGRHLGSVGGGCGEAEVVQAGRRALGAGEPRWVRVDLTEDVTDESEAACGGTMECLVRPWGAELIPVLEAVRGAAAARHPMRLLTCLLPGPLGGAEVAVTGGPQGPRVLASAGISLEQAEALAAGLAEGDGRGACGPDAGVTPAARPSHRTTVTRREVRVGNEIWPVLDESLDPPDVLLVCGGGHIALPVCEMGQALGFEVVVLDDRPSFANETRFPRAARVLCGPFADALAGYPVDGRTYIIIVTRGHRQDMVCLRRLLGRGAAYLGMIGSRRRVAAILKSLREEGVDEAALSEVHSPIGLDIGAETPAEIAVAILAEVVLVRRGGTGRPLTIAGRSARRGPDGSPGLAGKPERAGRHPPVMILGAGDLATGVAHRLYRAGYPLVMTELPEPRAVRRTVAFSECAFEGELEVEGVRAVRVETVAQALRILEAAGGGGGPIPVLVDTSVRETAAGGKAPGGGEVAALRVALAPEILVDARMAKSRNLGTSMADAPLVIGLGPGFEAGVDCHAVVETARGHDLGRVIYRGRALEFTGVPGEVGGHTTERLLVSPGDGILRVLVAPGDVVGAGQLLGEIAPGSLQVRASIAGIVRGLLRDEAPVRKGQKIGDIDPRQDPTLLHTISDKARAVGGGVLEAILCLLGGRRP